MRIMLPCLAAAMFTFAMPPAFAETAAERTLKAPQQRMGDEGKLPATEHMSTQVPGMTGGEAAPADENAGPSGPKGPAKRMGDEGKLPATNNMSNQLPQMTPEK